MNYVSGDSVFLSVDSKGDIHRGFAPKGHALGATTRAILDAAFIVMHDPHHKLRVFKDRAGQPGARLGFHLKFGDAVTEENVNAYAQEVANEIKARRGKNAAKV